MPSKSIPAMLAEKKARTTGLPVQVWSATHADSRHKQPKNGEKFAVVCPTHDAVKYVVRRRDAHRLGATPAEFCGKCRRRRLGRAAFACWAVRFLWHGEQSPRSTSSR